MIREISEVCLSVSASVDVFSAVDGH